MKKLNEDFSKYTLYFDSFECVLNEHVTFWSDCETAKKIMLTMADDYASHNIYVFAQMFEGTKKIGEYEIDKRRK